MLYLLWTKIALLRITKVNNHWTKQKIYGNGNYFSYRNWIAQISLILQNKKSVRKATMLYTYIIMVWLGYCNVRAYLIRRLDCNITYMLNGSKALRYVDGCSSTGKSCDVTIHLDRVCWTLPMKLGRMDCQGVRGERQAPTERDKIYRSGYDRREKLQALRKMVLFFFFSQCRRCQNYLQITSYKGAISIRFFKCVIIIQQLLYCAQYTHMSNCVVDMFVHYVIRVHENIAYQNIKIFSINRNIWEKFLKCGVIFMEPTLSSSNTVA
jgi:hypothetical protein